MHYELCIMHYELCIMHYALSNNDFLCYHVLDHPRLPSGILNTLAHLPMLANVMGIYLLTVQFTESLAVVLVLLQGARCTTLLIDYSVLVTFVFDFILCHNLYLPA